MRFFRSERGQTAVEFGIIGVAVMMLTVGVIDVGRGFFQYNAIASGARFGARWGSVVGGTCALPGRNLNDWCTQQGRKNGTSFWVQTGTAPLQGDGVACPGYTDTSGAAAYYNVSDYMNDPQATTIVGAIAQHFDSSSASQSFVQGNLVGFDPRQLKVCIQLSQTGPTPQPGDTVAVTLYYHFNAISSLFGRGGLDLVATSQYQVE